MQRCWVLQIEAVHVLGCRCRDLGENVRMQMVLLLEANLLHDTSLCQGWMVQWQECNSVCNQPGSCGEDIVRMCALEHTGCTQWNRCSESPTVRLTGFGVDVVDQDC